MLFLRPTGYHGRISQRSTLLRTDGRTDERPSRDNHHVTAWPSRDNQLKFSRLDGFIIFS